MPVEVERYFSFRSRRLSVRKLDAFPTQEGFEVLVNIQIFGSPATPVTNEIPYKAPAEVGGRILDALAVFIKLARWDAEHGAERRVHWIAV
jgi:hypothetical protein